MRLLALSDIPGNMKALKSVIPKDRFVLEYLINKRRFSKERYKTLFRRGCDDEYDRRSVRNTKKIIAVILIDK